MKTVASKRLVLWSGLLLPFSLLAGLYPWIVYLNACWVLFIALLAVMDWGISHTIPRSVTVNISQDITLVQKKTKGIVLFLANSSDRTVQVRIGFDAHEDLSFNPEEIIKRLDRGGVYELPLTILSKKRGEKKIEGICIEGRSFFGFWLFRWKQKQGESIKVYPNLFAGNQRLAATLLLRSELGLRSERIVGHGREFEQLREYLPDDNYADIAWKATAKMGKLITKVYQIERTQQIYIALDHSRTALFSNGEKQNLDKAVEGALLLQMCCEREGDMLGLIAFADRISRFCPARKGKAQFGILRNMLYDLTSLPCTPDFETLFLFIKERVPKRAMIFIFTNLEDPGLASYFFNDVSIINRTHLIAACTFHAYEENLLFSGEMPAKVDSIYERLAAQVSYNEQEMLTSRLKKQGIDLLRFRREGFIPGVIEHYLSVKRRQRL